METWLIIFLAVIVVGALTVLLYLTLFDDGVNPFAPGKRRHDQYVNDQTAEIVRAIKQTDDAMKAYQLFVAYIFTNHRLFLSYLAGHIRNISNAYLSNNHDQLKAEIEATKEMKLELKEQVRAQDECLHSIETSFYIETSVWINIANNTRFDINRVLRRLSDVSIHYDSAYDIPFPEDYAVLLTDMIGDICNFSNEAITLLGSSDVEGMRQLRKRISVVMAGSYDIMTRLYELIHDGRNDLHEDKLMALRFALNAMQECSCIIYSIRRLVLCNLCIALSRRH